VKEAVPGLHGSGGQARDRGIAVLLALVGGGAPDRVKEAVPGLHGSGPHHRLPGAQAGGHLVLGSHTREQAAIPPPGL